MSFRALNTVNITNLVSDPITASDADIYYNSHLKTIRLHDGIWQNVLTDNSNTINSNSNLNVRKDNPAGAGINIINGDNSLTANSYLNFINDGFTGLYMGLNSSTRNEVYAQPNDFFIYHGISAANINYVVDGGSHKFYGRNDNATPRFYINDEAWGSNLTGYIPSLIFSADSSYTQTTAFPGRDGWVNTGKIQFRSSSDSFVLLDTTAVDSPGVGVDANSVQLFKGTSQVNVEADRVNMVNDNSSITVTDDATVITVNNATPTSLQIQNTDNGSNAAAVVLIKNDTSASVNIGVNSSNRSTSPVASAGDAYITASNNLGYSANAHNFFTPATTTNPAISITDTYIDSRISNDRLYQNASGIEHAISGTTYFKSTSDIGLFKATSVTINSVGNSTLAMNNNGFLLTGTGTNNLDVQVPSLFEKKVFVYDTSGANGQVLIGNNSYPSGAKGPLIVRSNGAVTPIDISNISLLDSTGTVEKWRIGARDGGLLAFNSPSVSNVLTVFPNGGGAGISAGALNTISTATLPVNRLVPVFARRKTGDQSIPNVTDTTCFFETAYTDLENSSSLVGITSDGATFTNTSGATRVFSVYYQVNWASNATGTRVVWIRLNGASGRRVAMNLTNAVNGDGTVQTGCTNIVMVNNEFFDIRVYQAGITGGILIPGTTSISGNDAGYSSHISITWL
jgi:hypothetical protein